MRLLVQEADAPKVAGMQRKDWVDSMRREGLDPVIAKASETGDPPCPACGTAAPLVNGACSDCGLQLG